MSVKIIIRPIQHDPMEIIMGQAIWFTPLNDVDGISATANIEGFTPLTSITNAYDWDRELINQASYKCNSKGEIAISKQVTELKIISKVLNSLTTKSTIKKVTLDVDTRIIRKFENIFNSVNT